MLYNWREVDYNTLASFFILTVSVPLSGYWVTQTVWLFRGL